ncbi:hypothetical protein [Candidatus Desulforudis audaxviator]|uniref:Uncharacterized protein n=1 Tax=Desulforudis audaxviator (strain MP104C) TaxID=477974 RepID=B1I1V8_DESAP|nr:hypothetical protein [Candidatus Desulforudis audaxviator]ACA59010.1 hypothetical protein Daud_0464 [Candidatus Desulforudis audaxviator MP104C]AZK59055.1 hypothetical protein Daudx_0500 [Candidatus Desulforudis audaxviator]
MAFEVYTPKKRKRREEPKPVVSLSKSSIVLNKVARKTLPADRYELAFDRERRIIRLKPSPDGVFVKKTKINARGFFKQFDIDYKGKFTADYRPEEQALFVELPH